MVRAAQLNGQVNHTAGIYPQAAPQVLPRRRLRVRPGMVALYLTGLTLLLCARIQPDPWAILAAVFVPFVVFAICVWRKPIDPLTSICDGGGCVGHR